MTDLSTITSVEVTALATTLNENVLFDVCPAVSVTVTVYVATLLNPVGVPFICPLDGLKVKPVGSVGVMK